ncbi:MAG TPA: hypothetical protein VJH55_02565 [Candidatus Paceibacterota bacterium]
MNTQTFIHADIFFFITTIVVIIFAVMGVILAVWLMILLRRITRTIKTISEESEALVSDVRRVRYIVGEKTLKVMALLKVITSFISFIPKKRK